MNISEQTETLAPMAEEMKIKLYQRFSERDAAKFLKINIDKMKSLRSLKRIGCLKISHNQVEYFGVHLLQYLMSVNSAAVEVNSEDGDTILRMPDVVKIAGLSKATINRYVSDGKFPEKIALGRGSVGWYKRDVDQWLHSRKAIAAQ